VSNKNLFKRALTLPLMGTMRTLLTFALSLMLFAGSLAGGGAAVRAGAPVDEVVPPDVALYQALLDLTNPWTVMCVAAHPDDEDGSTLTVLRRKEGVHTVTLFSTYGEGGQNAVGPELYEELGAIRARETIEAAEVQGSEPYFLGLRDFGFSKSADEALKVWGHDEALRRMVLHIRRLRPDVIITNHDTTNGHGHHQATGRLVLEAFDAAADPKRFPEQLRDGLGTWQVQRLFVRAGFEGAGAKPAEGASQSREQIISVNPNEWDTVRGLTYAAQALRALRRHASQGPWPSALPSGGAPVRRYRLVRAAKDSPPLPDNAQSFLQGMTLSKELEDRLTPLAIKSLLPVFVGNKRQSMDMLERLLGLRKNGLFNVSGDGSERSRYQLMNARLDSALALASGIKVTVKAAEDVLLPDTTTRFSLSIANQGQLPARITEIDFLDLRNESKFETPKTIAPGAIVNLAASRYVPRDAVLTVPHAAHLYDDLLFGHRFGIRVYVEQNGARFPVTATTQVGVAPAVEILSAVPSPYVWTPATLNREMTFKLRLKSHLRTPFKGDILIASPANSIQEVGPQLSLEPKETRDFTFKSNAIPVDTPDERRTARPHFDTLQIKVNRENQPEPVAQQAVPVIYADALVAPRLRVAYVPSYDDTLKSALTALGVESHELTIDEVKTGDLRGYDTVIIDNRGYQAHPELIGANARLLDYARAGGTLIVFYHKTNEWNPDARAERPQLAPYPLTLGNSRVTDENATVTFTESQHQLLRWPNQIGADDFRGWIQERGLYYPQEWDTAHYSAPLSMSDTGETPLRGGLLATDYGRGRYIYTSIVWYRQLRAGVPGAYRMLANMISYGRAPREQNNSAAH
jgi:LmbE family N-acetylglucosaminyl deacetylase